MSVVGRGLPCTAEVQVEQDWTCLGDGGGRCAEASGLCLVRSNVSWVMITSTLPPVDRMTDRQDWKRLLSVTSLTDGKYLCTVILLCSQEYPEDEMLIGYDADFKHGQNFVICTKQEAKEELLKKPASYRVKVTFTLRRTYFFQRCRCSKRIFYWNLY